VPTQQGWPHIEAVHVLSGQWQSRWARSVFAAAYSLVCRGVMDSVAAARARERGLGAGDGGPPGADQVRSADSRVAPNPTRTLSTLSDKIMTGYKVNAAVMPCAHSSWRGQRSRLLVSHLISLCLLLLSSALAALTAVREARCSLQEPSGLFASGSA